MKRNWALLGKLTDTNTVRAIWLLVGLLGLVLGSGAPLMFGGGSGGGG
jgi:hypothetical protein